MGTWKRIWREMKDSIFSCIGIIICFVGVSIILEIIYRHWSWGWWFLIIPLFLIGLFLTFLPVEIIPIFFKRDEKSNKKIHGGGPSEGD